MTRRLSSPSPSAMADELRPEAGASRCLTRGFPQLAGGSVVTVGTFDGVHLGHRDILRRLRERAAAIGLSARRSSPSGRIRSKSSIRPPRRCCSRPTTSSSTRSRTAGRCSWSCCRSRRRSPRISAAEFVEHILLDRYHMRELVIGYDHGLGRGRQGDAATLASLGADAAFDVDVVAADARCSGAPDLVERDPHVDRARRPRAARGALLGRPYAFRGTVVPGRAARSRARLSDDEHRARRRRENFSRRTGYTPFARTWRADRSAE